MSQETAERIEEMINDPDFNEQEWREECSPSPYELYLFSKLSRRQDY